jgi:hypothetical protein
LRSNLAVLVARAHYTGINQATLAGSQKNLLIKEGGFCLLVYAGALDKKSLAQDA